MSLSDAQLSRYARHIVLRTQPGELIQAHNSGRPLCLAGPSHYADVLRMELTAHGLAPDPRPDKGRVMDLIPRIEAGTVWVNNHVPVDPNLPFGGYKQSGLGREFGRAAIEGFTEGKSVCIAY